MKIRYFIHFWQWWYKYCFICWRASFSQHAQYVDPDGAYRFPIQSLHYDSQYGSVSLCDYEGLDMVSLCLKLPADMLVLCVETVKQSDFGVVKTWPVTSPLSLPSIIPVSRSNVSHVPCNNQLRHQWHPIYLFVLSYDVHRRGEKITYTYWINAARRLPLMEFPLCPIDLWLSVLMKQQTALYMFHAFQMNLPAGSKVRL